MPHPDSQEQHKQGIHLQGHSGLRCEAHIPTLELSPPGSGPLSTTPSASFQLASRQCVQTMQYILGQRDTDATTYWLRHSSEMDRRKFVASLFQGIITDVK